LAAFQRVEKFSRRELLHLATGAAGLAAVSRVARADTYPSRPIRILVGFPAGGTPDLLARMIGQRLQERLGQPVIVEDRPGASSNVATEAVVRSAADATLPDSDQNPAPH
jgi:tripartite-type tricarboxylate transporter receptor subunit TctC